MKLFKRIFQTDKSKDHLEEQKSNTETNSIRSNSAFFYVQDKYGIDWNIYRKLSSVIHTHSIAAAN